jgi:GTPase SAR1 family protein
LWNGDALPVVLLANKVDLLGDKKADERVSHPPRHTTHSVRTNRVTSCQTLEEFAKENGFIGWFATSAKENLHVEKAMTFLINHIIHNYQNGPQPENTDSMHLTLDEKEIRKYEDDGGGCSC